MDSKTNIYQLHVSLVDSEPMIWRRILVPEDYTLGDLHYVIQVAMGWENCHLHGFRFAKRSFGPIGPDSFDQDEDEDAVELKNLLNKAGTKLLYEYDFGDSWEHLVTLEKKVKSNSSPLVPSCSEGENACPPEDIGGIWRYNWLIQTMSESDEIGQEDDLDEEIKELLQEGFHPERFDLDDTNQRLQHLVEIRDGANWEGDNGYGDNFDDDDDDAFEEDEQDYEYDAKSELDIDKWRKLGELDKIFVVEEYHRYENPHPVPNSLKRHAIIHVALEEQMMANEPPETAQALKRLMGEGLSRHDALHAIGSLFQDHIYKVLKLGQKPDNDAYAAQVAELTAKKWLIQTKKAAKKKTSKNQKKKEKNKKQKRKSGK